MEENQFVLPSNVFPSQQGSGDIVRPRIPLSDSTGNAQYHKVAPANVYHDQKGLQPRPPPNFKLPTLPSQPARHQSHRTALEVRKSHIRAQKAHRNSRPNPIIESEHYQAYRSRQVKGNEEDQKWPEDLEYLFLEGVWSLCSLPNMGRRKFSLNGKPHGRNELISLYLWMGHCESLAPGQKPDPSRSRTRKQVSSHIQVLKGFMRGHPAFDRLFPPKEAPRNGFEDSFKNDPTLRALAQGRLPHRRSNQYDFIQDLDSQPTHHLSPPTRMLTLSPHDTIESPSSPSQPLKPSLFRMYMTTLRPGVDFKDVPEDDTGDGKLTTRVHTYSDSCPQALGYSPLEMLPNWRVRFPILAQLHAQNDIKCDIIHLETSLEVRYGALPDRSELWGKFEILIPGCPNRQAVWRCTQSLYKPTDLYGPSSDDPPFENVTSNPQIDRYEPDVGTHIRVSFPASPWAYAFQRLSTMEAQFEEAVKTGAPIPTPTTARQYIDQITMFQEIFCSTTPNQPFVRKAILLWTFKKCKAGEQGRSTWSYLDPSPPRNACFSPHPGSTHVASAVMTENFTTWAETFPQPLPLSSNTPNPFNSLSHFDGLPPPLDNIAGAAPGMQYPFPTYGYPSTENMSFISHETQDSDATLVDIQNGVAGGVHMDSFLSNPLNSFDHSQTIWEAPAMQNFDHDSTFLGNFGNIPSSAAPHIWDASVDSKNEVWDGNESGFAGYDDHLSQTHGQK